MSSGRTSLLHRNQEGLLHYSISISTAAVSLASVATWMAPVEGVVWTPGELSQVALLALSAGALLGLLGAVVVKPRSRMLAAATGFIAVVGVLMIPWLPETGRARLAIPLGWMGMLAGGGLVSLGMLRRWTGPGWVPLAVGAVAWSVAAWPLRPATPAGQSEGPDILLVTVDTTRADLVPGFGGDLPPASMPAITAFSALSRRYTQAFAPTALTGPSHASMLSGVAPQDHGVLANGRLLPPLLPWVPALLSAEGWRTQAFVSTAVLDGKLGYARGFHHYDSRFLRRLRHGHKLLRVWPRRATGGSGFVRLDADTVSRALAAGLSGTASFPVFTWVHLYGPHWPYTPEAGHAEAQGVGPELLGGPPGPIPLNLKSELPAATIAHATALYRAELATLDDQLDRLLSAVPPDTVVIVVGDHGESLDEHGLLFNHGPLSTAPSTWVPLWVRAPGLPAGVEDTPVSIVDIAPTLIDLAGLDHSIPGRSLRQPDPQAVVVSLSSASVFGDKAAAVAGDSEIGEPLGPYASVAVRQGRWSRVGSIWHVPYWVDRTLDPRELHEGGVPPAEVADRLNEAWQDLVASPGRDLAPLEEDQQEVLEALGYLEPSQ